jgi:hypothetical protein
MVENLILLSGQVPEGTRTHDAITLRNSFSAEHQKFSLTPGQWTALTDEKPSPSCYLSDSCPAGFQKDFTGAIKEIATNIQTYLLKVNGLGLAAEIESQDTIFQPWICAHKPFCNL